MKEWAYHLLRQKRWDNINQFLQRGNFGGGRAGERTKVGGPPADVAFHFCLPAAFGPLVCSLSSWINAYFEAPIFHYYYTHGIECDLPYHSFHFHSLFAFLASGKSIFR